MGILSLGVFLGQHAQHRRVQQAQLKPHAVQVADGRRQRAAVQRVMQVAQVQPLDGRVVDVKEVVRRPRGLMQRGVVLGFALAVTPNQRGQLLDQRAAVRRGGGGRLWHDDHLNFSARSMPDSAASMVMPMACSFLCRGMA